MLIPSTPDDHSTLHSPALECNASVPSNNYAHRVSDGHNLVHSDVSTQCNQLVDENQYTGSETSDFLPVRASSPSPQFVSSTGIEWHSSVQLNTDTHHSMDIQFLGGIGNTSQSPDDSFTPEEQHDSFTSALSFTSQPSISTDMVICTASIYNTVDTHILVDSFPVLVVLLFLAVIYHKCISFPVH